MLDRAGFVGADGPTHHGLYDLTYLRMIPNMTIMVPRNGAELRSMMEFACNYESGPLAIRYPRGNTAELDDKKSPPLEFGKAHISRKGKDVALFAVGLMVDTAEQVDRKSTRLNSSHKPISYAVFCLKKKNHCDASKVLFS